MCPLFFSIEPVFLKKKDMEQLDKGTSILQKFIDIVKKNKLIDIIKAFTLLLIAGLIISFLAKPDRYFELWGEYVKQKEIETAVKEAEAKAADYRKRSQVNEDVRSILLTTVLRTDCDRAWLIECHNGTENAASGIGFYFGSMLHEVTNPARSVERIQYLYEDFPLTRFPLIDQQTQAGYYYGSVDDLKELDVRLYHELAGHGTQEFAAMIIWNQAGVPLGIIGLSFAQTKMNPIDVGREIRKAANEIGGVMLR